MTDLNLWLTLLAWAAFMGYCLGAARGALFAHLGLAAALFLRLLEWVQGNPGPFCLNGVVLLIQPVLCLGTACLACYLAERINTISRRPEPFYHAFASCAANALVVLAVPLLRS